MKENVIFNGGHFIMYFTLLFWWESEGNLSYN